MQPAIDRGRAQTKFRLQTPFFWIICYHQLLLVFYAVLGIVPGATEPLSHLGPS